MLSLGLRYLDGATIGLSVPSAMYWLESAAKAGSTSAMLVLGQMYENGYGIEQSSNVALKWYKWGAEKGSGCCAYNYAYLYEEKGGEDAPTICREMYQLAVEKAEDEDVRSDALFSLGLYSTNGIGTEKSDEKALEYLTESAELGNAGAQYLAGIMILNGKGCVPSEDEALEYLKKASEQGDRRADEVIANLQGV